MTIVSKSTASLRIHGDDLDPEEVSFLLGAKPTFSVPKNGFHNYPPGRGRLARTGVWRITTGYARPADLDTQVQGILARLTDDLAVWEHLSKRHRMDVFCGLWLQDENEMLSIAPRTLKELGERNITLELDIYFEPDDENTDRL